MNITEQELVQWQDEVNAELDAQVESLVAEYVDDPDAYWPGFYAHVSAWLGESS